MTLRATLSVTLLALVGLVAAPFVGTVAADAYPVTTCSTLAVSTTNPLPGQPITVSGSNFKPNSSVTLVLRPGDTSFVTAKTNASGAFSVRATLPDSITNQGHFDIVATSGAAGTQSCPVDPFQNLAVQAETVHNGGSNGGGSSGGGLAITGLDIAGLLALAAGLLGAGVVLNRRRTGVGSR